MITTEQIAKAINEAKPEDRKAVLSRLMRQYKEDDKEYIHAWYAEMIITLNCHSEVS
ncbi:MAG: hypothetical protein GY748_20535 [Planctomycetaceae bacterium]|nr:hypothetical protein [Planctomycetaceae bacterium]